VNEARRWIVIAIAVLGIIALVGIARNDPGVGGRQPDPPTTPPAAEAPATTEVHPPPTDTPSVTVDVTTGAIGG
jgi:hypothetical protein